MSECSREDPCLHCSQCVPDAPQSWNEGAGSTLLPERTKLTHVAIRFQGVVYSLPAPNRHHDVIRLIVETTGVSHVDSREEDQGFLDESGHYLNRHQALVSAELFEQLLREPRGILTSEDLW